MSAPARAPRLVLLDLDGTLIPPPSADLRLWRHLRRRGLVGRRQHLAWLAFLLGHASRGRHALRLDKAWLAGLQAAEAAAAARAWAATTLAAAVRPALAARIAAHRAVGDRLVLLTGALQPVAEGLAGALGLDEAVGTLCAVRDGRFTAAAPARHPFGAAKRALAAAVAHRLGLPLAAAVAYADSAHDLPLLEAVGTPVVVAPGRRLARLAHRRGWTVIAAREAQAGEAGAASP